MAFELEENGQNLFNEYHTEEALISYITGEAEHAKNTGGPKTELNMIFYTMVRTGQVRIVRGVFDQLRDKDLDDVATWLSKGTGRNYRRKTGEQSGDERHDSGLTSCRKAINWLVFLFTSLICAVGTPVFHVCHGLIERVLISTRKDISNNITLPIMFALMSENKEMFALLKQHGSCVLDTDSEGNNIFHYLADLSLTDPDEAIRCYEFVHSSVEDSSEIDDALLFQENADLMTGLEMVAKSGSVAYLHYILEFSEIIGKHHLDVTKNQIKVTTPTAVFNIPIEHDNCTDDHADHKWKARLLELDFGPYEKGDVFGKQSYLLQLITNRITNKLSDRDANVINTSKIFHKWVGLKTARYLPYCILAHILALFITVVFIVEIVLNKGDMNKYPLLDKYLRHSLNNNASFMYGLYLTERDCMPDITMEEVKNAIFHTGSNVRRFYISQSVLHIIIFVMVLLHMLLAYISSVLFVYRNYNFGGENLYRSLKPVLSKLMPGSYAEKQLTFMMYALFLASTYPMWMNMRAMHELNIDKMKMKYWFGSRFNASATDKTLQILAKAESYRDISSILAILCLLLRCLHLIHTFRLVPSVGFFILTTKKMGSSLLRFIVIFFLVLLSFATMLHLVLRDPTCPVRKHDDFAGIGTSLLTVYKLTLGYYTPDYTSYNTNALIAFILGSIIMVIMMLNLVVAVMTTTATDMNRAPWKTAICLVENWNEILGTEADIQVIGQILKTICSKCRCPGMVNAYRAIRNISGRKKHVHYSVVCEDVNMGTNT